MDYYAETDASGAVLSILGVEGAAPAGLTPLPGYAGTPPRPDAHSSLVLAAGSLVWQDLRTLAQVQADQISVLTAAYTAAIAQPVSYTSAGGVTKTYQADPASIDDVARMQLAFAKAGAVPPGFYWVAADNTQVPFTYADVQGLAAALGARGFTAFAHLQTQKAAVHAATTNAAVLAVTW
jgi:hypothetical protein